MRNFLEPDERQEFTECADRIFEKAKYIHMLGLKMSYTGDRKIIERIGTLMDEMMDEEQRYIPALLRVLKEKYS